jgi:hypothetical protein
VVIDALETIATIETMVAAGGAEEGGGAEGAAGGATSVADFYPPSVCTVASAFVRGRPKGGGAVTVACGETHSVVVTATGGCCAFGLNNSGKLGAGSSGEVVLPSDDKGKAVAVACGSNHTLVFTHRQAAQAEGGWESKGGKGGDQDGRDAGLKTSKVVHVD